MSLQLVGLLFHLISVPALERNRVAQNNICPRYPIKKITNSHAVDLPHSLCRESCFTQNSDERLNILIDDIFNSHQDNITLSYTLYIASVYIIGSSPLDILH